MKKSSSLEILTFHNKTSMILSKSSLLAESLPLKKLVK
jgi:hypothetical protein